MLRPARASSMIRRRYSGAYGGWVLGIGRLLLPFSPTPSTKAGQLQVSCPAVEGFGGDLIDAPLKLDMRGLGNLAQALRRQTQPVAEDVVLRVVAQQLEHAL